jgi:hypothetical protein
MTEHLICCPVNPARNLDAAALARTASWPTVLARGMEVNRVAAAVVGDRPRRDWRDRNLIDW